MAAVKVNTTVRQVLDLARSQLGVHEIPSRSNRTPYSVWYGMIGPWCAMFVSWVLYHAGAPLRITTSKGFAYTPYGVSWFKKKGAWAGPHVRPQPGWLIFFDFIGRPSHVGIVEGVAADGRIITLEGNTNSAGSRTGGSVMRHYRRRSGGVIGYGMIEYFAPIPSSPSSARPTLRVGMSHPAVGEFAWKMNASTGTLLSGRQYYGEPEKQACINFQKFFKLEVDGICGPVTWRTLDYIYSLNH